MWLSSKHPFQIYYHHLLWRHPWLQASEFLFEELLWYYHSLQYSKLKSNQYVFVGDFNWWAVMIVYKFNAFWHYKYKLSQCNYYALSWKPRPKWRKCFYWFRIDMSPILSLDTSSLIIFSFISSSRLKKMTHIDEKSEKNIFATGGADSSWGQSNCIGIVYTEFIFMVILYSCIEKSSKYHHN